MEYTARVSESLARKQSKALKEHKNAAKNAFLVTILMEDYAALIHKAQQADEVSKQKMELVILKLREAQWSKLDVLEKVEEAIADIESNRKVLREA